MSKSLIPAAAISLQESFLTAANTYILGKEHELRLLWCSLLAGGHVLIEDVPGVGKTTLVKVFARLLGLKFNRIQFTSDLLPADIVGSSIFDAKNQAFSFHPGPIFAQLVLGDELNRASPKTQSASLEAMEEQHVTVDGESRSLPQPFFFIATQNPQQSTGTFALPESQLDRFLMRLSLGLPSRAAERTLLLSEPRAALLERAVAILSPALLIDLQVTVRSIHVSPAIIDYVLDLAAKSRSANASFGLSPRATMGLLQAARAWAFSAGRSFVIPEDVQAVAIAVINHRLNTSEHIHQAQQQAKDLLLSVAVP